MCKFFCANKSSLTFGICYLCIQVEEESMTVPLIVVSPAHLIQSYRECLSDNDYFGMNSEKVFDT